MFIKWYSMNSIKKISGIRCNSNPNFTSILLVIPIYEHNARSGGTPAAPREKDLVWRLVVSGD